MSAEGQPDPDAVFAVFNGGGETRLTLPSTAPRWRLILDTSRPEVLPEMVGAHFIVPAQAVIVFEPVTPKDRSSAGAKP